MANRRAQQADGIDPCFWVVGRKSGDMTITKNENDDWHFFSFKGQLINQFNR